MDGASEHKQLELTELIQRAQLGCDNAHWDRLYEATFQKQRAIARSLTARESRAENWEATALVGSAFLKLRGMLNPIVNRDHFFSLVARAMRQSLIEQIRMRRSRRPTPEYWAWWLAADATVKVDPATRMALQEAMGELEELEPRVADAVRMRYESGNSLKEIADKQGRAEWEVKVDCKFGLHWLSNRLT